ncbi:MAG: TPM domain-containing protein [Deltaproteobacteria bacterium]|nr:TPM domain-containing protein [Deltaproteobacteria bacterium]
MPTTIMRFICIGLSPFVLSISLFAAATFPEPRGFVNDFAGVFDATERARLNSVLTSFEKESSIEIAVATLSSLEGRTIEDVAADLFAQWNIGKKGKDNGLLFLVAPNDRRVRVEVGYGLEGTINDALAGRILDTYAVPSFKAGDYNDGIAMGTLALLKTIVEKEGIPFDLERAFQEVGIQDREPAMIAVPGYVKLLLLLLFFSLFFLPRWFLGYSPWGRRGGGGFFGGFGGFGGSGGFGGFGGGRSGGGGSSRGW